MEPRELLQWLLDRDGDNSNSLAAKLKNATSQPQIYKYLHGKAVQPRRTTLAPVAKHYGIPIDALYDEEEADRAMAALKNTNKAQQATTTVTDIASRRSVDCVDNALRVLAEAINQLDVDNRDGVAGLLSSFGRNPSAPGTYAALLALLDSGNARRQTEPPLKSYSSGGG